MQQDYLVNNRKGMRSIADYARRHFGTQFKVGQFGDGMVSGTQSTVSMAGMVQTDVGKIQPRVNKLVDARTRDELEYFPKYRRNGLTAADLLNTGASRKLSSGQMSLGLMMEIHRYLDKYSSSNKVDRFHEIICSLFEVTKMTATEKNTMHVRVKREVDRMKKLKKAKQTSQIEIKNRYAL
ncbi:unnamed protein product [Mytilus coruscus]|uniref:Uncharacterized protein n=1 Tax=Mytilus coruscus TaxID=42192 RepID=A0A6J8AYX8_MYTCO|nr:unnamed protein product [Mytilus coruscus]